MLPLFTTLNKFAGNFISLFLVLGLWYSNAFSTAWLPLNSNRLYDNRGKLYNVTRAIDDQGLFDAAKYENYSPAFLAAGSLTNYVFNFAIYTATFMYALLYHHHEIKLGFVELWHGLRWRRKGGGSKNEGQEGEKTESRHEDVHNRLMAKYKDGEFVCKENQTDKGC
jgi:hypothetical protein